MNKLIKFAGANFVILGYFWLTEWYAKNIKNDLLPWIQTVIWLIYIFFIICAFAKSDLFFIKWKDISPNSPSIASRIVFYMRVFIYYCSVIFLPLILIIFKKDIPSFVGIYGAFLFFSIMFFYADYAIPSYERYKRNASRGKLGYQLD